MVRFSSMNWISGNKLIKGLSLKVTKIFNWIKLRVTLNIEQPTHYRPILDRKKLVQSFFSLKYFEPSYLVTKKSTLKFFYLVFFPSRIGPISCYESD